MCLLLSCSERDSESHARSADRISVAFTAHVSPASGTITIVPEVASAHRGLEAANVVQDRTPGTGPAESVELITTMTAIDLDGSTCGYPNSFCGDVTIRSFYTSTLRNVWVEINAIIPASGHDALNSDPAPPELSNTLGLWGYGDLAPSGTGNRLWVFGDNGEDYIVRGRVMADLPQCDPVTFVPDASCMLPGECATTSCHYSSALACPNPNCSRVYCDNCSFYWSISAPDGLECNVDSQCSNGTCMLSSALKEYAWQLGAWSACTAGTQTRVVTCEDEEATPVGAAFCGTPPQTQRPCP